MGTNGLKKVLATLLAASMLAPTAAALSEEEEAMPTKPATTIEEQVIAPSIEDLCLSEEYIAFLNQNNIKIVDGNIVPATVKDFKNIVMFHQRNLYSKGISISKEQISNFVFIINIKHITPELIKELIDEEVIYPESIGLDGTFEAISSYILQKNRMEILNGNYEQIVNFPDMLFSIRGRKIATELHNLALEARECIVSNDEKRFTEISDTFFKFITGEEQLDDYSMNDSDDDYFNVSIAMAELTCLSLDTGLYMDTNLFKYAFGPDMSNLYSGIPKLLDDTFSNARTLALK